MEEASEMVRVWAEIERLWEDEARAEIRGYDLVAKLYRAAWGELFIRYGFAYLVGTWGLADD